MAAEVPGQAGRISRALGLAGVSVEDTPVSEHVHQQERERQALMHAPAQEVYAKRPRDLQLLADESLYAHVYRKTKARYSLVSPLRKLWDDVERGALGLTASTKAVSAAYLSRLHAKRAEERPDLYESGTIGAYWRGAARENLGEAQKLHALATRRPRDIDLDLAFVRAENMPMLEGARFVLSEIMNEPERIAHLSAQSLAPTVAGMLPGVGAAVAGGGRLATALAVGVGGGAVGTPFEFQQALSEAGIDIVNDDPDEVIRLLNDPDFAEDLTSAQRQAITYGLVLGAMSTVSAGAAGLRLGSGPFTYAAQVPLQGALEAAGEGAAQLAARGEVSGGELAAEAVVGGALSSLDVGLMRSVYPEDEAKPGDDIAALAEHVAEVSKAALKAENPEAFEEFVEASTKGTVVFVTPDALETFGDRDELLSQLGVTEEQMKEARATGGRVAVKASRIAVRNDAKELFEHIKNDATTDYDASTANEVEEVEKDVDENLRAVAQDKQAAADAVAEMVRAAGRPEEEVAPFVDVFMRKVEFFRNHLLKSGDERVRAGATYQDVSAMLVSEIRGVSDDTRRPMTPEELTAALEQRELIHRSAARFRSGDIMPGSDGMVHLSEEDIMAYHSMFVQRHDFTSAIDTDDMPEIRDLGDFRAKAIAFDLYRQGALSEEEMDSITELSDEVQEQDRGEHRGAFGIHGLAGAPPPDPPALVELKRVLSEKGIRALKYRNLVEGGEGYSVAVLDPSILTPTADLTRLEGLESTSPGPNMELRRLTAAYMEEMGIDSPEMRRYVKPDRGLAERLAAWFEAGEHAPDDPETRRAYETFVKENNQQLQALMDAGFKFERGVYEKPHQSIMDLLENRRMTWFPTELGFGPETPRGRDFREGNIMLEDSPFVIDGKTLTNNDVFRIVHDVFGHGPEGMMFGPRGEENAWIAHMRMYSKDAARVATTELRAQNAWVNFGPMAARNRKAADADVVFADQKMMLAPDWAMEVMGEPFEPASAEQRSIPPFAQTLAGVSDTTQRFFTEVAGKLRDVPERAGESVMALNGSQAAFYETMARFQTAFPQHIAASIPGYQEAKSIIGESIARIPGLRGIYIAGSEGDWAKAIAARGQEHHGQPATITVMEPNEQMQENFYATPTPTSVDFSLSAFGRDTDREMFAEWGMEPFQWGERQDFMVESIGFQFMGGDRNAQMALVKENLKPDGFLVTMQKMSRPTKGEGELLSDVEWEANEERKNEYKQRFFDSRDLARKAAELGNMAGGETINEEALVGSVETGMVPQKATEDALQAHFRHVVQWWDSGNFKGYIASDSADTIVQVLSTATNKDGMAQSAYQTRYTPTLLGEESAPSTGHVPNLRRTLSGDEWLILTTDHGQATDDTWGAFAYAYLKERGAEVYRLHGKYRNQDGDLFEGETTWLAVRGASEDDVRLLASATAQESYLAPDGMKFINHQDATVEWVAARDAARDVFGDAAELQDFFSRDEGGNSFSLGLVFEQRKAWVHPEYRKKLGVKRRKLYSKEELDRRFAALEERADTRGRVSIDTRDERQKMEDERRRVEVQDKARRMVELMGMDRTRKESEERARRVVERMKRRPVEQTDAQGDQDRRGGFYPAERIIELTEWSDPTTLYHELAHASLELIIDFHRQGLMDEVLVNSIQDFVGADIVNMTGEDRRVAHERFAEGFEQFLYEGKAPTPELRAVFRQIVAWFRDAYRSMAEIRVVGGREITPEMRDVYARLLVDDDIPDTVSLFDARPPWMTPKEYQDYQALATEAKEAARDKVRSRLMRDIAARYRKERRAAMPEAIEAAEQEILGDKRWQVYETLRTGEPLEQMLAEGEDIEFEWKSREWDDVVFAEHTLSDGSVLTVALTRGRAEVRGDDVDVEMTWDIEGQDESRPADTAYSAVEAIRVVASAVKSALTSKDLEGISRVAFRAIPRLASIYQRIAKAQGIHLEHVGWADKYEDYVATIPEVFEQRQRELPFMRYATMEPTPEMRFDIIAGIKAVQAGETPEYTTPEGPMRDFVERMVKVFPGDQSPVEYADSTELFYFADLERPAIQRFMRNSRATLGLKKGGVPMVLYHGTTRQGIEVMDPLLSKEGQPSAGANWDDRKNPIAAWASSDIRVAASYNKRLLGWDHPWLLAKAGERDGHVTIKDPSLTMGGEIIPTVMNLENPLIVDANDAGWTSLSREDVELATGPLDIAAEEERIGKRKNYPGMKGIASTWVARLAKLRGHDGVIFLNMKDSAVMGYEKSSTIVASFTAERVKDIRANRFANTRERFDQKVTFRMREEAAEEAWAAFQIAEHNTRRYRTNFWANLRVTLNERLQIPAMVQHAENAIRDAVGDDFHDRVVRDQDLINTSTNTLDMFLGRVEMEWPRDVAPPSTREAVSDALNETTYPVDTDEPKIREFMKDSYVTDGYVKGGSPKVIYHGTAAGYFRTFRPPEAWDRDRAHFWGSDSASVALSYTRTTPESVGEFVRNVVAKTQGKSLASWREENLKGSPYEHELYAIGKVVAEPDFGGLTGKQVPGYDDLVWKDKRDTVYPVVVRLKNPLIIDAEGSQWNRIRIIPDEKLSEVGRMVMDEILVRATDPKWVKAYKDMEVSDYAGTGSEIGKDLRRFVIMQGDVFEKVMTGEAMKRIFPELEFQIGGQKKTINAADALTASGALNNYDPRMHRRWDAVASAFTDAVGRALQGALMEMRISTYGDLMSVAGEKQEFFTNAGDLRNELDRQLLAVRTERNFLMLSDTTGLTKIAKKLGADGVIFKNVDDAGGGDIITPRISDVIVAFKGQNVRDVRARFEEEGTDIFFQKRRLNANVPRAIRSSVGEDPDVVAEEFGYRNGDELVAAINSLGDRPNIGRAIRERANRKLDIEMGLELTPEKLRDEVEEALATEEQAAVLTEELRLLKEAKLRRPAERALLEGTRTEEEAREDRERAGDAATTRMEAERAEVEAFDRTRKRTASARAKRLARGTLQRMREQAKRRVRKMKVSEINALGRTLSDVRKAARLASVHVAEGDFEMAEQAKRRELYATVLAMELSKARDYRDKVYRAFKRWEKMKPGKAAGDTAHLKIIQDILKGDIESVKIWMRSPEAEASSFSIYDSVFEPSNNPTMQELQELYDSLRSIAHVASALGLEEKQRRKEVNLAVVESIQANMVPRKDREELNRITGGVRDFMDHLFLSHRKAEHLFRELDGFSFGGTVWSHLFRPVDEAASNEASMRFDAIDKLKPIWNRVKDLSRRRKDVAGMSMSRDELVALALNYGNEGNREALFNGSRPWTEQQVEAALNTLSDEDWDFVEDTWALIDSYWPAIAAIEERTAGVVPPKVEPMEFKLRSGRVIRGGYYPIMFDPKLSAPSARDQIEEQAEQLMRGEISWAATPHGHTKERTGSKGSRKRVWLSTDGIFRHLDRVIHDLTHREPVREVSRILNNRDVQHALSERYGVEVNRYLGRWLQNVAAGTLEPASLGPILLRHLRVGMSVAEMGASIRTMLVQPMGLTQSVAAIGPRWVLEGIASLMVETKGLMFTQVETINSKSPYMRERATTFDRDIAAVSRRLKPGFVMDRMKDFAFWGIGKLDMVASYSTWLGAYKKGTTEGMNERDAVAYADQTVRTTQGSGLAKDLSDIQSGGEFKRIFTAFYTFFAAYHNMTVDAVNKSKKLKRESGLPAATLYGAGQFFTLVAAPAILTALALDGGPDDEEEWWEWASKILAGYGLSSMIWFRDVGAYVQSDFGYSPPPIFRAAETVLQAGTQMRQGEVDKALVRSTMMSVGYLAHVPSRQAWRAVESYWDYDGVEAAQNFAGLRHHKE